MRGGDSGRCTISDENSSRWERDGDREGGVGEEIAGGGAPAELSPPRNSKGWEEVE